MRKVVLVLRLLMGLLFLSSAGMKAASSSAFSAEISMYGIIRHPLLLNITAIMTIAFEAGLGMALLSFKKERQWLLPLTFLVLLGFSLLLGWGWAFKGLSECGCFGQFLQMTPGVSIAKNIVLMAMVGFIWRQERGSWCAMGVAGWRRWLAMLIAASLISAIGVCRLGATEQGAKCRGNIIEEFATAK